MTNKLTWFGRVERRKNNELGLKVSELVVKGSRGRPKKKWLEVMNEDTEVCGTNN